MSELDYANLDWSDLLTKLSSFAVSVPAKSLCLELPTNLTCDSIKTRWNELTGLKDIIESGYGPPLMEFDSMLPMLKAVRKGQILAGADLYQISRVLENAKSLLSFCRDFREKSLVAANLSSSLTDLPDLLFKIQGSIGSDGEVLDSASPELQKIRTQMISKKQSIETTITKTLTDQSWQMYLQDTFFTLREDKYVVPIKLDGHGRVPGRVIEPSASGQSLFMEPQSIVKLNEDLAELYLQEKLIVMKILKAINQMVYSNIDVIEYNYENIIHFDFLVACSRFASKLGGVACELVENSCLDLKKVSHPLLKLELGNKVVANNITLDQQQRALVISGPNAGGKTVVLKTVGLIHLMAKAGLLLPLDPLSKVSIFTQVMVEIGDSQSIASHQSSFSSHMLKIKKFMMNVNDRSLLLVDEIASGTDPKIGAALAKTLIEYFIDKKAIVLMTTHFDPLKMLGTQDERVRNGAMLFNLELGSPSYQLAMDTPGQSFGLELLKNLDFPDFIIESAKGNCDEGHLQVDQLLKDLNQEIGKQRLVTDELSEKSKTVDQQLANWQSTKNEMKSFRKAEAEKISRRYQELWDGLRDKFNTKYKEWKDYIKNLDPQDDRQTIEASVRAGEVKNFMQKAGEQLQVQSESSNSHYIDISDVRELRESEKVWVESLQQKGTVEKIHAGKATVRVGMIQLKVGADDIKRIP